MLEQLSEKFAGKLVVAGIISETDADVYVFGFYQFMMLLLNVVTTLLLGGVFRLIIPCFVLNMAYIPIRISAGGHHADSPVKCYIYSTLMIAILLGVIKWIPIHPVFSFMMLVVSGVVIWIFAPVETENNPLDKVERRVYRKRAHIVLIVEIAIGLLFLILAKNWVVTAIALGVFTECLMLLAGMTKNQKKKRKTTI